MHVRKPLFYTSIAASIVTCSIFLLAPLTLAATASNPNISGQALEIAPPLLTLTANPGQTITAQLNIRDVASGSLLVTGQVNDFVAAGEDGTPKILLNDDGSDPYSIKSWIPTLPQLLLTSQQIKTLPITINVPKDASPGGHYGVIRFTATPPELHGTGVSLSASLGSLVLLTVKGNVKESLSVQSFTVSSKGKTGNFFESAPLEFDEKLQNNGNVHELPTGVLKINDMFGHPVAALGINMPPHNVLPSSVRKFSESLDSSVIGNKRLFGHYQATMSLTYGANKQIITDTIGFWVIPYRLVGAALALIIGGFFVLRFLIRRYNRYIINKVQNAQKKK